MRQYLLTSYLPTYKIQLFAIGKPDSKIKYKISVFAEIMFRMKHVCLHNISRSNKYSFLTHSFDCSC